MKAGGPRNIGNSSSFVVSSAAQRAVMVHHGLMMMFQFEDPESSELIVGEYAGDFAWRSDISDFATSLSVPADPIAIFGDVASEGNQSTWQLRYVTEDSLGNPLLLHEEFGSAKDVEGCVAAVEAAIRGRAK